MLPSLAFIALFVLPAVQGLPSKPSSGSKDCGPVSQYYDQKTSDWNKYHTGDWLNMWWNKNNANNTSKNPAGFAGEFGQWAMGNPDWSCRDDGSNSDCDLNLCGNKELNGKGKELRQTYYVLESVNRLHSYFTGVEQAFTTSALDAALSKDDWAETFYSDDDDQNVNALKEVLSSIGPIIGIGVAFAGFAGEMTGAIAGAASSIIGGAIGIGNYQVEQNEDDTFTKSADLGGILGQIVTKSLESFTTANNQLMAGKTFKGADIRSYLSGGAFVAYEGVDKNAVTDTMTSMLIGASINQLYRQQKIFVMGGGACGDGQGIGSGPKDAVVCRDGKAWYLYYWTLDDVVSVTSHQWGWVTWPPGASQLGKNEYSGVTIQDIINSSLDAYNVAGYSYTGKTLAQRSIDAVTNAWANPGQEGPAWEGIFTVPVCDVGSAINSTYYDKQYILQPYNHESRPVWCGPICNGDLQTTQEFINATNMYGFQSPKHLCPSDPGY
ncbi:hypothetical protein N7510_010074 [Penicillium lagena]|uniref:uncharacterized protein n=1 Tax=Penicillium lagena TaxID=94218 RepID=UPI002541B3E5|nr:uncharacterized protein N7510_010074 [Penicillium lagena]KAJ5604920.1 hypothetical protein N7510_010074 [Penicillium lagena]